MTIYNYEIESLIDDVKNEHQYLSETKKEVVNSVKGNYPQLCTYESEWIYFDETGYISGIPVELEYQTVEGTNCIVENAIPVQFKSAILKGNTLVNLINKLTINAEAEQTEQWYPTTYVTGTVKSGKYILLYNVKETSETVRNTPRIALANGTFLYHGYEDFNTTTGIKKWIFTANADLIGFSYWLSYDTGKVVIEDFILLEYQDGMENWDIPYFEGMKSVQMPVLKATGKNLFDVSNLPQESTVITPTLTGYILTAYSCGFNKRVSDVFPDLIVGKTYVVSFQASNLNTESAHNSIGFYNSKTQQLSYYRNNKSFTLTNEMYYERVVILYGVPGELVEFSNVQIEEGTIATSYEPYKSNILTVNEDVTLRSNGDACDELNLLTGRLTQRIDENNEVLAQAVVKTVDLTPIAPPFEGYNIFTTSSDTIPPIMNLQVPVVSTGEQTLQEINN